MKPLTLQEVIDALEGTCERPAPAGSVSRVSIDSRTVAAGDLFVAIRGERFDGHDFVGEAFAKGAMAALEVTDLDAFVEHLKTKSISLQSGPFDTPVCRVGSVMDPDGNEIILHQKK